LDKSRVFLSLNLSGNPVLNLRKVQEQLKDELKAGNLKWEDPAKLHLTLRFLGDIFNSDIPSLGSVLNRLKFEFDEIRFSCSEIGFFPGLKYPNVVFAELSEIGENCTLLVEFIDKIIYNFGVKPDKRFIPHITLGRFRRNNRVKLEKKPDVYFDQFGIRFRSFFLMKSELSKSGSVYSIINEFEFRK
jgi:RNA 2',3'-cyclic 3'-phosphodiesterase